MVCVRDLLNDGNLPRLEAQILLRHVLQVPRVWLVTHDRDPLDSRVVQQFRALEAQRLAGHPMAYLMGEREFFGHDFQVCPSVLIPRPETELLVETAIEFLQPLEAGRPRVVDLGSGSGAIAVSIALACPFASVAATDVSLAALDVASLVFRAER